MGMINPHPPEKDPDLSPGRGSEAQHEPLERSLILVWVKHQSFGENSDVLKGVTP